MQRAIIACSFVLIPSLIKLVALRANGSQVFIPPFETRCTRFSGRHEIICRVLHQPSPFYPSDIAEVSLHVLAFASSFISHFVLRCLIRQLAFVKIRSYSKNAEELWLEEWSNPLQTYVDIDNPDSFKAGLREQLEKDDRSYVALFSSTNTLVLISFSQVYIDKLRTGFLVWNKKVKAYTLRPDDMVSPAWEDGSAAALSAIESVLSRPEFFKDLAQLWSQETDHRLGSALDLEVRKDNVTFMKTLGAQSIT